MVLAVDRAKKKASDERLDNAKKSGEILKKYFGVNVTRYKQFQDSVVQEQEKNERIEPRP